MGSVLIHAVIGSIDCVLGWTSWHLLLVDLRMPGRALVGLFYVLIVGMFSYRIHIYIYILQKNKEYIIYIYVNCKHI